MSTHHGLLVHIVFSTKWRYPLLKDEWRDELFGYIGGTIKEHKAVLMKAGGIEDHVHLFVKTHPRFALADTVQALKANSSRWINENQKTPARFSWQRGYGGFSVSQSMAETVKAYITNQRQHHQNQTFREEYLQILRKHEIDFDEQYVFEQEVIG